MEFGNQCCKLVNAVAEQDIRRFRDLSRIVRYGNTSIADFLGK